MVLMSSVSQRPNHHNVQNNQINSKFICQLRKSETVLMLVATEYTLNTVYRSHTLYLSLEHCRMEWKMHNTVSLSLLFVCWIFLYVHIQQSSSNKLIKSNDTCQQVNNQQQKKNPHKKPRTLWTVYCLSIWMGNGIMWLNATIWHRMCRLSSDYKEKWNNRVKVHKRAEAFFSCFICTSHSTILPMLCMSKIVYHVVNGLLLITQWNCKSVEALSGLRLGFMLWQNQAFIYHKTVHIIWIFTYFSVYHDNGVFYFPFSHRLIVSVSVSAYTIHFQFNIVNCHLYYSINRINRIICI